MQHKLVHHAIITVFVTLYALVATISMINSVAFFDLAHDGFMSWVLAIGFELGAAASLGAIIILDRTNKAMVWGLFILLTLFQMMANSFHAYVNLQDYIGWIELFGLERMSPIEQKRILSIISGAVLPVVSLGFIKSLVDYIRPEVEVAANGLVEEQVDEQHESPSADVTVEPEAEIELQPAPEPEIKAEEPIEAPAPAPIEKEVPAGPVQPAAQPVAAKPAAPAKPSQPEARKMSPANSGGASMALRTGMKTAPVAGSPSR